MFFIKFSNEYFEQQERIKKNKLAKKENKTIEQIENEYTSFANFADAKEDNDKW